MLTEIKDDPEFFRDKYSKKSYLANASVHIMHGTHRVNFMDLEPEQMDGVIEMLKSHRKGAALFYDSHQNKKRAKAALDDLMTLGKPEDKVKYKVFKEEKSNSQFKI